MYGARSADGVGRVFNIRAGVMRLLGGGDLFRWRSRTAIKKRYEEAKRGRRWIVVPDVFISSQTPSRPAAAPGAGAAGQQPARRYGGATDVRPWLQLADGGGPRSCPACDGGAKCDVAGDVRVVLGKVMITAAGRRAIEAG
jgi:hypothetical protein